MAPPTINTLNALASERFAGGGNRPIRLTDPDMAWYVAKGAVDVFLGESASGEAPSDLKQMLRAGRERLIFGVPAGDGEAAATFIGKALPDTELLGVRLTALADDADLAELLVEQVDAWVTEIAAAIARDMPRPRPQRILSVGDDLTMNAESVVSTRHGVAWVTVKAGAATFFDASGPHFDGPDTVPVTAQSWLRLFPPAQAAVRSTQALQADGLLLAALAEFHRLSLSADEMNRRLTLVDRANLQRTQAQHRRESEEQARDDLLSVLNAPRAALGADEPALHEALKIVGRHEGIDFRFSTAPQGNEAATELAEIQRASGVRSRMVRLADEDRWWLGDSGALLAFHRTNTSEPASEGAFPGRTEGQKAAPQAPASRRFHGESERPVALIPGSGRYRMVDPETGKSTRVDQRLAQELAAEACFFYRPLPQRNAAAPRTLFPFAFRGLGGEVARFAVAGAVFGLLMLTPSILLGRLVDHVFPSGSVWLLAELALSLVFLAVLAAIALILQGMCTMRLEALAAARLGAAVWDRLLGLPQRFFRRFAAGDLAMRAMTFQHMRDGLSGVVGGSLLAVVFLLPTFLLLFFYDARMGWLGLGLGLISMAVAVVFGIRQLPLHRRMLDLSQRLSGQLLQLLHGVSKLRATGSEGVGFALWAKDYGEQKHVEMRLGALNEHLIAFLSAAPLLAAAAFFALAVDGDGATLPTGDFLTIYAAFMAFYAAIAGLGGSFSAVVAVLPAYEHVHPILAATPETSAEAVAPPELSGDVQLDHVNFRYTEDGPWVLRDVSVHARAGQFVAIVGESGAGKSTLFQLAIGLETPVSGTVYYDGHDLGRLNKRAVRSDIAMVVQDASLQPGSVLDNIIGLSKDLTEEDAWRAARLAAVDKDIAAMPMQMHTAVAGGTSFSGGQVQRIMLAAALARDPTVLFLDEATNWLDNKSQAAVMKSVSELAITRFVSAHRLSTIREADSIYVLEQGRVAQMGTFEELIETVGPFRDLIRRQMA